jgi:LacI family transcriptional regulator
MARRKSTDVTIFDVAKEAGVSYSTVSRVVNNKAYVKRSTREKVLKAMDRLGYRANLQARSLAGGRSSVIGLLVVDLATEYVGELVRGIDEVLAANKYELMVYTTHRRVTKEADYVNMMARGFADGLLIVLPREPGAYLLGLRERQFPYVLIDQFGMDDADLSVIAENQRGAYEATQHLIELGHTRIGMITGWMDMASARQRLDGYRAALSDFSLPIDQALIYEGNFSQQCGRLGAEFFLDMAHPPTAIFASNDDSAVGAMEAARGRGLAIPADLSIIGFDDIPMARVLSPRLTTVRQPLTEMGSTAAQLLLDQIHNPAGKHQSIILPIELIVRESTAGLARGQET